MIHRYQGLPPAVRGGDAEAEMFAIVDDWVRDLGDKGETAEARLVLLNTAADVAPAAFGAKLAGQRVTTRLALAAGRQAEWPLDALALLMEHPADAKDPRVIEAADPIVARLLDSPSLLLDAGDDLDTWLAATGNGEARDRTTHLRHDAQEGRDAAQAEGVTAEKLGEMQAKRPWDQHVQLALARGEASAGKLDAAAARLARLGTPGTMIRDARLLLAQLTAAQGKLEDADALLSSLLAGRLPRFTAASRALIDAGTRAEERVMQKLQAGTVPADLGQRVAAATSDAERRELIRHWGKGEIDADQAVVAARAKYVTLADVVPVTLEAGTVKLRRAQAMSGAAQSAMLKDAERTFLAIRSEAEGQPQFRLALGEIYARLGKIAESDAELGAVLDRHDPELSLQVADAYRGLGSLARAKQIAGEVFASAKSPDKETAAYLLALMSVADEAEAETWYRKADPNSSEVQAALLELEGARLGRQGKAAECEVKYAAAAKLYLGANRSINGAGYNNAALAYQRGFDCSSDPQALRDAEAALEHAYADYAEDPIVTENLAEALGQIGPVRVLARHANVRALRLGLSDIRDTVEALLQGPEGEALRTELTADPSVRRSNELAARLEVLAPNNPEPYLLQLAAATLRKDAAAAAAVVERARHAKALDHAAQSAARERWVSGAEDARVLGQAESVRAHLEALLTGPGAARLDAKTRAVGGHVLAQALAMLGLYKGDPALLARSREATTAALPLWPALGGPSEIETALIDEAGLAGDAKRWIALRRTRSAVAALDKLAVDRDPLADRIRASKSWTEVAGYARADRSRPGPGDLRLARLLGDAALETRARAVLDDKLAHLQYELGVILDPSDEVTKADLAYLDAR